MVANKPDTGKREITARSRHFEAECLGALPTATGGIARYALEQLRQAGIDSDPLLKKAGLTQQQMEDRHIRLTVKSQISFLNLAARALNDDYLGFHIAQQPDLREIGLLFYVMASSDTLWEAIQNAHAIVRSSTTG